ncbi:MAG: CZB domain-containing protein [Sphingobium sp.]|nr:CZB domain-containing protein [Sphingobium sp.]MCP5398634.1 CZB domain-containing protein [Sphingomonas sp.]
MAGNAEMIDQINNAIGAHGAWKLKLRIAMSSGSSEIDPDRACVDNKCPFGKWIHGDSIDVTTRQGKPYQVVRRLHAEFHESAANVLRHAITNRKTEAEQLFQGEFAERSDKLVRALAKWKGELL